MGARPTFPGNPRQAHEFIVAIDGFDAAYFQRATVPELEIEVDEFNPLGSVRATKFAGRMTVGDCELEKGVPADRADNAAWLWLISATNTKSGDIGNPGDYKRDIELREIDHLGNTMRTWILKGAWVKQLSLSDFEGESSDHMIETLTLSVDDIEMR